MKQKGCGCNPAALAFLAVIYFAISLLTSNLQYNSIKKADAFTEGTISSVTDNKFYYAGSDVISIDYTVEDKDYFTSLAVQSGSIKEGDTVTLYYNPAKPESVTCDEYYNYIQQYSRNGLIWSGIIWGVLFVLSLIGAAVNKKTESASDAIGSSSLGKAAGVTPTDEKEAMFWGLFGDSLKLKNQAKLSSALEAREEGLSLMEDRHDYYCMAQHNLMVLQYLHCGDGVSAYESGIKSLKYKDEYRALSDRMKPQLGYSTYDESLLYTATLAKNRDEAKELFEEVIRRNAYPTAVKQSKEMLSLMDDFPKWADYQKNYAHHFYSRHTAAEDRGDHAPACALLGLILSREGEKGYDISQEDYVDMLDDYLVLSAKYFTLRSSVLLQNGGTPDRELMFIVRKPLQVLIKFLPDCDVERYKDLFRSIIKEFYELYDQPFRMYLPEYEKARKALGM